MNALELRNRHGERLDHACSEAGDALVIIAHGVTSSHDRPYLVALSEGLAAEGLSSLRFSFAGNGASEGRFEDCTISKEIEDLGSVLDALGDRPIAYVGHSMGAAVGVLRAVADPRLRALVSLAGMVRVNTFFERHFGDLMPGAPMLGRERCPLAPDLLEDARRIDTVLPQARRVSAPWLLVHGTADELVPLQDSVDARAAADASARLVELPDVDHRFTSAYTAVVEAVVPWLVRKLDG